MLVELSIRNLAVIESVRSEFGRGFHVLSGETGAGKSIVIDALSLIAGGRGSSDLVRYGCDKAEIEALFELPEGHPVWGVIADFGIVAGSEEPLLIRREITSQGKSTSRINGHLVNLTMLREVGEWLVNIHGQHEHQSLLRTDKHLQWLDLYETAAISPVKLQYGEHFTTFTQLSKELEQLQEQTRQGLQMADLYRFQLQEISAAALKPGEEEALLEEKRKLANAEKLSASVNDAYELLNGNRAALEAVSKAVAKMEAVSAYDPVLLSPLLEQMQGAFFQLEDAGFQLRDYRDGIEFNPERLSEVEQRLNLIAGLKRKYGATIEEIVDYERRIAADLETIEHKDERMAELDGRIQSERAQLIQSATELSQRRHNAAGRLSKEIEKHLADLQMERTIFEVKLESDPNQLVKTGIDKAEFLIAPNPGEPTKPLAKIASGGELSRIMLAMKSIFAALDQIPVLVFDEVDTGVSGRAAQAIAEKMSQLAAHNQVFSITHLPQVACMADRQYLIQKQVDGERTYTTLLLLEGNARAEELARMIGGAMVTATTLSHASEMLELAQRQKLRVLQGT